MANHNRPITIWLYSALMVTSSALTGYFGLSAHGYLVPALVLLLTAVLFWMGKAGRLIRWLIAINLLSAALLVVTLAFGDFLGDHKLDVSAIALLANLVTGGPLFVLVGPGLLIALSRGQCTAHWFRLVAVAV